nr:hypothetical protein [Tanacetum cinerariifolium]
DAIRIMVIAIVIGAFSISLYFMRIVVISIVKGYNESKRLRKRRDYPQLGVATYCICNHGGGGREGLGERWRLRKHEAESFEVKECKDGNYWPQLVPGKRKHRDSFVTPFLKKPRICLKHYQVSSKSPLSFKPSSLKGKQLMFHDRLPKIRPAVDAYALAFLAWNVIACLHGMKCDSLPLWHGCDSLPYGMEWDSLPSWHECDSLSS